MINFLGTLLLLGCLQGVVAFVLLYWSGRHRRTARLLGILILLISLATFKVYTNSQGWWDHGLVPILIATFVPFFLIMPVGPLVYFYVKLSLQSGSVLDKRGRRHFFPVVLDLVPALTALLYVVLLCFHKVTPGDGRWGDFIDTYNVYVDIPRWISVTVYVFASWRLLRNAGSTEVTRWLRQLLWGFTIFLAIWLLYLVPYVLPASGDWLVGHLGWYPLYIPLVILSYWLGIRGYLSSKTLPVPSAQIDRTVTQATLQTLEQLMSGEKLYRDPELSLARLAIRVGVAPKILSSVMNQHLGKRFNEYVNEYRVREVQDRLLNGECRAQTIAALAYESGFNSLQTFQRAFKAISGITPSEFVLKSGFE